ncbi:MAG: hypothetical protein AB7S41_16835 [Parvibaculaceae bacterium]
MSRAGIRLPKALAGLALVVMAAGFAGHAGAQDARKISVELNSAQSEGEGCRISFVFQNGLEARIEELAVEVVLFDDKNKVSEFLLMKTGPLPPGKVRVRQFELKARPCAAISRLLVNDVKECKGEALSPNVCLEALSPKSTASIRLEM